MQVRPRRHGWVSIVALTWRSAFHRFSFLLFIFISTGLLVLGQVRPIVVENFRVKLVDGLAPVLDAVSRPLAAAENVGRNLSSYLNLREENERLKSEVEKLVQWQNAALAVENENKELRALLHYKIEPRLAYISARVIADTGGPFFRSLIVTAGRDDGVREGMAAMTGEGLVGRVVEVGDWSSRILLITDINSRIPVTVTESGEHSILTGDNVPKPKLLYLPQDSSIKNGALVVTSGHGGVFPPNLPVGVVSGTSSGEYEVTPLAAIGRISHVRLIDFNLKGGNFNPMAAKISSEAKNKK